MRPIWLIVAGCVLTLPLTAPPAAAAPIAVPVVTGLADPTMFTVASDGRIFYSERTTGRIGLFDQASGTDSTYFAVSALCTAADQGLYGLALHPGFPTTPSLYAFATRRVVDGSCHNQVLRIDGSTPGARMVSVLFDDPYVAGHNGGRLLFGPDGQLYVSTGDGSSALATPEQERAQRAVAQDTTSPKGKILRMTPSGGVPGDNPFGNLVFAYGFRNVFGFDFDPSTGQLWATDNGPEPSFAGEPAGPGPNGGCNDEVNRVVKGANYGWGPASSCGKPPEAPLNSNQDGAQPVLPVLNIEAASGIAGARFCSGCGLGPEYEGRLLYVDFDYRSGNGTIRAATLSANRMTVVSDVVAFSAAGSSPLSIERSPDGTMYFSDDRGIYKLAESAQDPPVVVAGAAFYIDGTSTRNGPSGVRVSVFATSAEPGFNYRLVSGRGTAQRPCSTDVMPINDTLRFANAQGVIGQTAGTLNRPAGQWQICFLAEGQVVTGAATYTVTS